MWLPFVSLETKYQLRHLFLRRMLWITHNIRPRKFLNLFLIGLSISLRKYKHYSFPFALKIDTTPNCQLHCPVCIHGWDETQVNKLDFSNKNMSFELFKKISAEAKGRTSAISFYYLGEPFMNKDILKFLKSANSDDYSTFISSNFSFNFSDKKIFEIVESGLTSLTVCLDGMNQETYSKTRVGGNINFVKDNLKKVQELKSKNKSRFPVIEVQYLKYPYNSSQEQEARDYCNEINIENFTSHYGTTEPWVEPSGVVKNKIPKGKSYFPKCLWPWISLVVEWDGNVVPCCSYRVEQAVEFDKPKKYFLGNLQDNSLSEIWNGEEYQRMRKFILDPASLNQGEAEKMFCFGCSRIYE